MEEILKLLEPVLTELVANFSPNIHFLLHVCWIGNFWLKPVTFDGWRSSVITLPIRKIVARALVRRFARWNWGKTLIRKHGSGTFTLLILVPRRYWLDPKNSNTCNQNVFWVTVQSWHQTIKHITKKTTKGFPSTRHPQSKNRVICKHIKMCS